MGIWAMSGKVCLTGGIAAFMLTAASAAAQAQEQAQESQLQQQLDALQRQNQLLQNQTEALQRQNQDVQTQMEALRAEIQRIAAQRAPTAPDAGPDMEPGQEPATWAPRVAIPGGPAVSFGGQYRVNAYNVDNEADSADGSDSTAARLRIRQNLDIDFTKQFRTHLQLELGHTTDNVTTTNNSSRGNTIAVRHALMDYTFGNGINAQAGIVPLSDRFGDVLFSGDWDYNPLALSLTAPLGGGDLRLFAANLSEGTETTSEDDFIHYQLDYVLPFSRGHEITLGGTLASLPDSGGQNDYLHTNYGIGGRFQFADHMFVRGFVLGSHTDRQLLGTTDSGDGFAAKLEFNMGAFGLMATHASGESDGGGFLPLMVLAPTNGYWGYTGLLTIQGPTDTGFDGDSVNISNSGFGLTTVQARYARPLNEDFDIYLAAGWFGNSKTPSGRDSLVGTDFLAMVTYHFNPILALDAGVGYAMLEDSVSGYSNGVLGGASFNQAINRDRDKAALFLRLQAEW